MNRFAARARALRQTQTGPEARLWQALRGRKLAAWKFRRQMPLDRFTVDFACLDARLVIEIDGATHGTDAERARDEERTRVLESHGFHVVRFANADVMGNLDGVLETILAELEHRTTL